MTNATTENVGKPVQPRKSKRQRFRERSYKDAEGKERVSWETDYGSIRVRRWRDAGDKEHSVYQADFGAVNGKRCLQNHNTMEDAYNWLYKQHLILEDQGRKAFTLTAAERLDAVRARAMLKDILDLPRATMLATTAERYADYAKRLSGTGQTIQDAVSFFLKHCHTEGAKQRTVAEAIDEYVADAKANNLRPASIRSLFYRLQKMKACIGERPIREITKLDADKWIDSLPLSPMSKKHHRTIAHGLLNFAIDKGYYSAENPFMTKRHRRKYHEDEVMPVCMTWRDVQRIMSAAVEHESSMVPALAVGFFAGVRTNELRLLDWQQIDLAAGRITVLPAVAKRRRTRHITMEPNLVSWLLPHRQEKGMVAPDGEKWRSRLDTVREKAGVAWPHNAMRHSYASHHYVKYSDAARTASQLGHGRDVSMLFEHYRSMVTPEDATAYFDIRPDSTGALLAFPKTA